MSQAEEHKEGRISLGGKKQGILELTSEEVVSIDLIFTKERLAIAEEKLAMIQLRNAQSELMRVGKSKAVLMARLGDRVGGCISSAKIVGNDKLVYELG